jgi:thymidine phosphorylase
VVAPHAGFVSKLAAEAIGRAAVALGAGRGRLDDVIDPGVGIEVIAPPGTEVARGAPVLAVRHRQGRGMEEAMALLTRAIEVSELAPSDTALIVGRISGEHR